MVEYHFLDKAGNSIDLDEVERKFLKSLKQEPQRLSWISNSVQFELLVNKGIACTFRGKFDNNVFCRADDGIPEADRPIYRKFLTEKYKFESWR